MNDECTQLKVRIKVMKKRILALLKGKIAQTEMHSRFNTIFGPFAYKIIDWNNFCRSSSLFASGTSCQCFNSFVCNVVAPKNWISDDCAQQKETEIVRNYFSLNLMMSIYFVLPFLIALIPIQRTMLVGSIGLWSTNHVHSIAVERPIDKIRLQLLQGILYQLPHPFCYTMSMFRIQFGFDEYKINNVCKQNFR